MARQPMSAVRRLLLGMTVGSIVMAGLAGSTATTLAEGTVGNCQGSLLDASKQDWFGHVLQADKLCYRSNWDAGQQEDCDRPSADTFLLHVRPRNDSGTYLNPLRVTFLRWRQWTRPGTTTAATVTNMRYRVSARTGGVKIGFLPLSGSTSTTTEDWARVSVTVGPLDFPTVTQPKMVELTAWQDWYPRHIQVVCINEANRVAKKLIPYRILYRPDGPNVGAWVEVNQVGFIQGGSVPIMRTDLARPVDGPKIKAMVVAVSAPSYDCPTQAAEDPWIGGYNWFSMEKADPVVTYEREEGTSTSWAVGGEFTATAYGATFGIGGSAQWTDGARLSAKLAWDNTTSQTLIYCTKQGDDDVLGSSGTPSTVYSSSTLPVGLVVNSRFK